MADEDSVLTLSSGYDTPEVEEAPSPVTVPPEDRSPLSRAGDKGESSLTVRKAPEAAPSSQPPAPSLTPDEQTLFEADPQTLSPEEKKRQEELIQRHRVKPPEEEPDKPEELVKPLGAPEEKKPDAPQSRIFGLTTIFHYNWDGTRDKDDPGSTSFFGYNLDNKELAGVAVPVDILEAQFGKFTRKLPNGTYAALDTPEAREIIERIKHSHVRAFKADGTPVDLPIVDIQGSYGHWHRTLDLTYGAALALGLKDNSYLGYQILGGDGTVLAVKESWSDSSPLAKFYQEHGKEFKDLSQKDVLAAAKAQIAPEMPDEQYEEAMRSPEGKAELAAWKEAPRDPGQQLSAIEGTPYYGLSGEDLTKKVYSDLVEQKKIDPAKVSLEQIRDRLFPHPGAVEQVRQLLLDEDPSALAAAGARASEITHQESAKAYGALEAAFKGIDDFFYGNIPVAKEIQAKADQFFRDRFGGHNYFKELVSYFDGLLQGQQKVQEQAAANDAARAAQREKTVGGKIGGVVGGTAAGVLTQLPVLVPGAPVKSAAALAALYEGASTFGREAQKGQKTAFIDGLASAGMGAIWRYAMNAPAGRATTAFNTWLAGTGEDALSKMIRGEHIDGQEFFIRSTIDLTTGALMGGTEKDLAPKELETQRTRAEREARKRSALARQVLGPEISEELPWYAPGPIVSRLKPRTTFSPGELALGVGELPAGATTAELARRAELLQPPGATEREVHLADPEAGLKQTRATVIRQELRAMQQFKENGELERAALHGNRVLSMLNGEEQTRLAGVIARFSEKWADTSGTAGQEPHIKLDDTEKTVARHHIGLGTLELLEDQPLDDRAEINNHFSVEDLDKNAQAGHIVNPFVSPQREKAARVAYRNLLQRPGQLGSAVFISDLAKELQIPVAELHEWIRQNPGKATLDTGHWPSATEEQRAGAFQVPGRDKLDPDLNKLLIRFPDITQEPVEFHAGLSFKLIVAPLKKLLARGRTPQEIQVRERMEAILKHRRSEAEEEVANLPKEFAHALGIEKVLRGSEKVTIRRGYFAQIGINEQRKMLIAHERGLSSGRAAADEIFKLHDLIYDAIFNEERAHGFKYNPRDVYIYHLIKGGKKEKQRFEAWFNKMVAANPRFVHSRKFGFIDELHKAGFELETYNPEDLLQRRLFQSQMAVNKVMQLRDAERAGLAYNTARKNLLPAIKAWGGTNGELIARAPNGERYYVRPDAQELLRNAWDTSSIYDQPYLGRVLKTVALAKEIGVPWKLKGLTHLRHVVGKMNIASFAASLSKSLIHGKLDLKAFNDELARTAKFGYAHSAEVEYLQGKRTFASLSDPQKTNLDHFKKAGLSARVSDETRIQYKDHLAQLFSNVMEKAGVPRGTVARAHGAASLTRAGYDILSTDIVQDWMFHTAIPQTKFSDFIGMRDDLLRRRPELLKPENEWKLQTELSKIGKMVEAVHGEMFYDNLLWPKIWKDVGKIAMLSLGWNVGAWRIFAGGLHDIASLGAKLLEDGHLSRDDVTWRMLFGFWYGTLNALEAGLITYTGMSLWNATHPTEQKKDPIPNGRDWVWPRVGYDAQGKEKRVAPVEYSREFFTLQQHIADQGLLPGISEVIRNKLNPALSTIIELFQNKNYYGQQISDPLDPGFKKAQDTLKFVLQNTFEPIAVSAAPSVGLKTGKDLTWWDTAWAVLGFPPAAGWVGRSDTENRIVDTAHELMGKVSTELSHKRGQAYDALRLALKAQDAQEQQKAIKVLSDLGVKPAQIKGFKTHLRKNPDETYVQHLWKGLPSKEVPGDTHVKLLRLMTPQERQTYWKLLSPNAQLDALKLMRNNPEELRFYWPLSSQKLKDQYARSAAVQPQ